MRFDILTIFPGILDSYLQESILRRAKDKRLITVTTHDIRRFATDKHHTTDDRPYGGGPGMVMKIEPLYRCLRSIRRLKKSRVVLLSAKGKPFTQQTAQRYAKLGQLVLVCGRYEGVDERIRQFIDEEVSIGPYVVTGGELPALSILDATARLLPGVLGHPESTREESFSENLQYREYPHYTRPEVFRGKRVPRVLLGGDHQKIKAWRHRKARHGA
jgi:tRNA (guanine37-N1)-methyltransferase